jgi:hypothetical protein
LAFSKSVSIGIENLRAPNTRRWVVRGRLIISILAIAARQLDRRSR